MTTELQIKTRPLFDPTWEPKFKSGDLVSLHGINGINKRDRWVVYGRMVEDNAEKTEWYFVRPGTTNHTKIGKIRVLTATMRRESKFA